MDRQDEEPCADCGKMVKLMDDLPLDGGMVIRGNPCEVICPECADKLRAKTARQGE